MSPFCRQCRGIARVGEARCPLDQEFYIRRDCPKCGQEVFPREVYCAHCRALLAEAPETVLLPAEAGRTPMAAALFLDLLGFVLLSGSQLYALPALATLTIGLAIGLVYRSLARAHGRQTFGQTVFRLLTVSQQAGPAGYEESARRSLAELGLIPWSFVLGERALRHLDDISLSYEVRLD